MAALRAAAASMTAGRDLLHAHAVSSDDGTMGPRSEWAPVVVSIPVCRVLLHEVGAWAGKIAPHGGQAALTSMTGTTGERRALNGACQWLWVLQWAVEAASDQQPLPGTDLDLLYAIPVNAAEPRHLPAGSESVTSLCRGIVGAADRVRAAASGPARAAAWSQELTRESLRHAAAHCTVTSWSCHQLLDTLAAGPTMPAHLATALRDAADAADCARAAWLRAAEAWDVIVTDAYGGLSQAAIAAEDLALWTGRLAYADPQWTPALGPRHASRTPPQLALGLGDLRRVVAAAHHACHAAGRLAASSHEQLQIAAAARRLVIPARNLPHHFGIQYPFSPAPPESASSLLDAYQLAADTSDQAASAIAGIAEAVKAPSRILTTAQNASRSAQNDPEPPAATAPARRPARPAPPGPAERVLLDLGVTSRPDLHQAAALDQATSQLLLRAATTPGPVPRREGQNLISSAGTAELINHLFATGHGETVLSAIDQASGKTRRPSRVLVRAELPASPIAARQARQHLRRALAERGLSALAGNAELLASELVTNAAKHAGGTKIGLVLRENTAPGGPPSITCEVWDHSATLPRQRPARPGAQSGRGLAIVAALAADSGVRAGINGKTCWFTLAAPQDTAPAARPAEPEPEAEAGS
jgi:anti-sigma regulatory factor (Ser/Thr protein kinase)